MRQPLRFVHDLFNSFIRLREDGLPLDPWLRTHIRIGGEILLPMEHCQMFAGPISEWAKSTNLVFQHSGQYIIPGALSPLFVDEKNGTGVLAEGNVWVSHPLV